MTTSPPAGLSEGYIALPPDSTGKQLRAFPVTVYEQQSDGTFLAATAYQQTFVLVSANGDILGTRLNPVVVEDKAVTRELRALKEAVLSLVEVLGGNTR